MLDTIKLFFRATKELHRSLQRWAKKHKVPYTRLLRCLLHVVPWSKPNCVTYCIAIPVKYHKDGEQLRAALDLAVARIVQEYQSGDSMTAPACETTATSPEC